MKSFLSKSMTEATRLVRSGKLTEATAMVQRLMRGDAPATAPADATPRPTRQPFQGRAPRIFDVDLGGAQFATLTFDSAQGSRDYKLFVPTPRQGAAMPLLVMLHGCTQSPDDFAAGTRMNDLAEAEGFLVAYPAQTKAANPKQCWNWFSPGDQGRDRGEPALIAGITRQVMAAHPVDPDRVYVAGLSAGGAAAAVMGLAYPDLYAAVGVHSGLAQGAASDVMSALTAMKRGAPGAPAAAQPLPTIVFHADRDRTVHPRNGEQVIAQMNAGGLRTETERGEVEGGHAYTRTLHRDAAGRTMLEHWLVHRAGHAWSGGDKAGSFTDPRGPDASRAMLRFFLEHRRTVQAIKAAA